MQIEIFFDKKSILLDKILDNQGLRGDNFIANRLYKGLRRHI